LCSGGRSCSADEESTLNSISSETAPLQPPVPARHTRNKRRRDRGEEKQENSSLLTFPVEECVKLVKKPKTKVSRTNEELAASLVKKIYSGMKKMRARVTRLEIPIGRITNRTIDDTLAKGYKTIILECHQHANDGKQLHLRLQHLLEHLLKYEKSQIDDQKISAWIIWYFSACLELFMPRQEGVRKSSHIKGASVIHRILNYLIPSYGCGAFAVIGAFMGKTKKLDNIN
jgi:hypothetical protein